MDQPLHDVHVRTPNTRRGIALVVVGILHLGFVYALAVGLAQGLIQKLPEEIKVAVEHPQEQKAPPPPPPPDLAKPPPPVVPPPEIVIQQQAPAAAITTVLHKEVPQQAPAISTPVSYGKHNCQKYYPDASQRLQETGDVTVAFTITPEGDVTNVVVKESSGKDRLDQAAVQCVSSSFHYHAATQNGQPISVPWATKIVFQPAK